MSDTPGYRRIATEEAFAPPEILERYRALLDAQPSADPGFTSLWGFYLGTSPRVLYAMDYPYQYVPDEVRVIDGLPISDLDKVRPHDGKKRRSAW
jgi:hypothetical protein